MCRLACPLVDAARSGDPAVFSTYLAQTGQDFLLLDDSDADHGHVRFTGRLLDTDVVWDCHFVTLKKETERLGVTGLRCFIDIGAAGPNGVPIRVGLNLRKIDRPDILKMIVMIRNYRRLRPGRQEFGDYYPLDGE